MHLGDSYVYLNTYIVKSLEKSCPNVSFNRTLNNKLNDFLENDRNYTCINKKEFFPIMVVEPNYFYLSKSLRHYFRVLDFNLEILEEIRSSNERSTAHAVYQVLINLLYDLEDNIYIAHDTKIFHKKRRNVQKSLFY